MSKFLNSALAALGALASFAPSGTALRYPHATEMEALGSDWTRIGSDMRTVVARENGKVKKVRSTTGQTS